MSNRSIVSIKKEKEKKRPLKSSLLTHFLCSWPQLDKRSSGFITSQLVSFFNSHPELANAKTTGKTIKQSENGASIQKRSWLVVGIREVTKAVEKDKVLLMLVCQSAKPLLLTQHLALLTATRSLPAGCVAELSEKISPYFGFRSVLALAILKNSCVPDVSVTVDAIKPKLKPFPVPWLETEISNRVNSRLPGAVKNDAFNFLQTRVCVNQSAPLKKC